MSENFAYNLLAKVENVQADCPNFRDLLIARDSSAKVTVSQIQPRSILAMDYGYMSIWLNCQDGFVETPN